MSKINHSRKKKSFSLLTLIAVIFAVFSISFGTIIYSANSASTEAEGKSNLSAESASTKELDDLAKIEEDDDTVAPDAVFTVNDSGDTKDVNAGNGVCADSAGKCTLRAAIEEANALPGNDEINFSFTTPTEIQLNAALSPAGLTITQSLKITGKGARNLTIKGNSATTAGIFKVNSGAAAVSLSGLTVVNSGNFGVNNEGELSLSEVAVKNNGTGINNAGKLTITRATISGNSKSGLVFTSASEANISNTTISGNQSLGNGGGINSASPTVTLNNVTITNNTAAEKGGGVYFFSETNGFFVRNSIIAGNTDGADADIFNGSTAKFTSRGNNIIGKNNNNIGFENNTNNDKVGTIAVPIDPKLGPLQNNGGQTDTHAVLPESLAIKAGSNCVADLSCGRNNPASALNVDQRGANFPRVYQETTEIGAFEAFYPVPVIDSLSPQNSAPGADAFELTVTGSKFVKDSVVKWQGAERATTFVSNTELKIQVSAADVATVGVYAVTVTNPEPGGGTSQAVNFTVPECSYAVNPASQNVAAAGGNLTVTITAQNGCRWTAVSDSPWLTFSGTGTGNGNGTLSVAVAANNGIARVGKITIGGKTFTVNQAGNCTFSISPQSYNATAAGGANSFNLTASDPSCTWTATKDVTWINILDGSGSGSKTINFTVAANDGIARTGKITVNGINFTVNQSSGCTTTLTPTKVTIIAAGASGSLNITSGTGCGWTASTTDSWITVNAGTTGTGNGVVSFTVAPNTGPARTGKITVNDKTFEVNQESGCTYTITNSPINIPAGIYSGEITVTTNAGCMWSAQSNDSWITLTGNNANRSGSGTTQFSVAANVGPAREGTISIAGKTFTIKQADGCSYNFTPANQNFAPAGGTGTINIAPTSPGCQWTATSNSPWVTITAGGSGTGNGVVSYSVAPNTGVQRNAAISINGRTFNITQDNGCTFTLLTGSRNVGAAGEAFTVGLTASSSGCVWTAQSNDSWISVSPVSGTGNATVNITVAANTGPQRVGTVKIGNQTFTVTQANGCTFALSLPETIFDSAGGSGSLGITTNNQQCGWTATTAFSWITFVGASSGTGNGTISYVVQANITPERIGTIEVGGKTFKITQRNGCSYSLATSTQTVPAAGGSYSFIINSGAGCQWSVASNESWIAVTGSNTGAGSSSIAFTVGANAGPARSGTITAGGKTFTVNQDSGCRFTLTPTQLSVPAAGGTSAVNVNASDPRCTWTAQSNTSWISISGSTGGTGSGSVQLIIAANVSPQRTGSVTIAGIALSVIQINGCVYSLTPTSASVNENGGTRSFNVTTGLGCTWSAVSDNNWITVTSGATGTGNGTVQITVAANAGQERQGTVTVENQKFTVYQVNLIVSNLNDSGTGSLRQAVINANNTPGDDVITFNAVSGLISLTSGEIEIANNGSLEIRGPGAYVLTISGSNSGRLFYTNKAKVAIKDLTLINGNGIGVNGQEHNPRGGAIYANQGSLELDRMMIIQNRLSSTVNGLGAGVFLDTVTNSFIRNSTFYNNSCSNGAGLYTQYGVVSIINSTFSENTASREGGGIYSVGNTTLRNVTVSNNVSGNTVPAGAGVSIWGGAFFMSNSIIAGNIGPEITFNTGEVSSLGNNLIGDASGDSADTSNTISYRNSDILNTDPKLAPLWRYGGTTTTMALMPSSPAINAGSSSNVAATDQRGSGRSVGGGVDIGAFEYNITLQPLDSTLPKGTIGTYYSQPLSAARIDNLPLPGPFIYEVLSGSLPTGMTMTGAGLINGVPTTPGVYSFYILSKLPTELAAVNKYTISIDCTFSIDQTTQSIAAAGGTGSFNVSSSAGCNWAATKDANWINISSAVEGSGNGTVSFTVLPNTGSARTGKITVGGQTFTVTQAAGCTYSLSASSANVQAPSSTGNFNIIAGSGCGWSVAANDSWITITGESFGSGNATVKYTVAANNASARIGTISAAGKTFTIDQEPYIAPVGSRPFDFDGDGKSDVAFYRPENGEWHVQNSTNGLTVKQWGAATDKIVPADYDGDKKTDHAVFRDGYWLISASTAGFISVQFGLPTDIPAPADFDGDGKSDVAVYRPSNGYWYIMGSQNGFSYQQWGDSADKPIAADFDGDGKADITVFRPSNGIWYMLKSRDGFYSIQWGESTDKPIVGDYDGDGRMDVAVFRPSSGFWYILQSRNGFASTQWGMATDLPTAADYDGDGKTDFSVYRDGTWHLLCSTIGYSGVSFGFAADKPIANTFIY